MPSSGTADEFPVPCVAPTALPHSVSELSALATELELRQVNDVEQMYADGKAIEARAAELGDVELQMRARLIQGDVLDRKGDIAAGAKIVWEVNRWAAEGGHRSVLARSHVLLSSAYHYLGDPAACLEHAVRALELLDDTSSPRVRALYLVKLGDALGWLGSYEAARERYLSAECIVVAIGDDYRHLQLLNNLAYTECDAGEPERAWAVVERMRALAAALGRELDPTFLDTVASAQMALGRYADAVHTIRSALELYERGTHQDADGLAESLLTLAESERLVGDLTASQRSLDRCVQTCHDRGLTEVAVRAMQEQAALHAARGEYQCAYEVHTEFHTKSDEINSLQREAIARTRQAMFETAEAREAAELFREQARRDSLTGLHNRRYVDEALPLLLQRAALTGCPVSVGLVDLDHFKLVNDSLSHETGDQVLVTVAALLTAAVTTSTASGAVDGETNAPFVARIGGEEFLVAFPGTPLAECARHCEEIRVAVGSHPWHAITGSITVTVSIGVAAAVGDITQSALLRLADGNLYIAKRAGRNRVVAQ